MSTLTNLPIDFPTLGWTAVDWIEAYTVHGPGPVQGLDVTLTDEECRFLAWLYRLDPKTGRRLATDADLSAPKGWRKSALAGWICLWEAFGPCRFDGWGADTDDFGNREPVGRPLVYPFARILATEEEQSGNTYDNVHYVLTHGSAIEAEYSYDVGLGRTYVLGPGGGEIVPSTSGDASKDGGKETFVVPDEVHLYTTPVLHRMYDTVERNMRKRKLDEPLMLRTSTAFRPGEGSVAEEERKSFEDVGCDVERALHELGLLVDHRAAPDDTDINNDKKLQAALEEVYGDAREWVDIPNIIRVNFRRRKDKVADSCRYYLNQLVRGTGRWVDMKDWDALADPDLKWNGPAADFPLGHGLQPREAITLGFDGSRYLDATVLMACRISDGLLAPLGWWERPKSLRRWEEWEVPADEVDAAVHQAFGTYRVRLMYPDPPFWREEVDGWHGQWPDRVVKFETAKEQRMVFAVDLAESLFAAGTVTHNGDPRLRAHVANTITRKTKVRIDDERFGHVLVKETKDSTEHIDGAVSSVLALQARGVAISKGAAKPRRKRRSITVQ